MRKVFIFCFQKIHVFLTRVFKAMFNGNYNISAKVANRIFIAILIFATIVYVDVSFVNHYLFRTYSLDLGAYTKCLYDFMHGVVNDSLVYRSDPVNCFASHFDLYLVLFAPFVYVFGTYTLLVIQIVSVLVGAWGIFKLIGLYTENRIVPLFAVATFLSFFGVYHAFTFDYHSNVVATMLVPWFFYFFKKQRYICSSLFLLLIIIAKENLSLFMAFVCLGLIWDYRKDKRAIYLLLIYIVLSLLYFFLINSVVMPYLNDEGQSRGFVRYRQWGDSYFEVLLYFITNPTEIFAVLFGHPKKIDFFVCLFFSGGIALLLKPNYLIMIIPLVVQKMLAKYSLLWSIYLQYNVEFAPIVVVAVCICILKIKKEKLMDIIICGIFLSTITTLIYTIEYGSYRQNKQRTQIFRAQHYKQPKFDVTEAYSYLKQIPDTASVCASGKFVPHLCLRKEIYTFPNKKEFDTEWMLLYEEKKHIDFLLNNYMVVSTKDNLWLLRKKKK